MSRVAARQTSRAAKVSRVAKVPKYTFRPPRPTPSSLLGTLLVIKLTSYQASVKSQVSSLNYIQEDEDDEDEDEDDEDEDDDDDDEEEEEAKAAAESGGRIGIFLCFFLSPALPLFSISVNSAFPFVSVYALSTSGITTVPHNSGRGED